MKNKKKELNRISKKYLTNRSYPYLLCFNSHQSIKLYSINLHSNHLRNYSHYIQIWFLINRQISKIKLLLNNHKFLRFKKYLWIKLIYNKTKIHRFKMFLNKWNRILRLFSKTNKISLFFINNNKPILIFKNKFKNLVKF